MVWSLKDVSFEIKQGDAVGIIGRNGAGKSTLLKVLSKVTSPTQGSISGRGRIASLLEVGTGFHPELTGRENIYLNGAILGMRKAEIKRQFDAIVDFAGVERYIDTPVKRYSSGMYVRLAFAVAAHLESEILIVDEVLAVGDAEFQKKCLGKMNDVSKGEGRTVLFVSHNMGSIAELCRSSILMKNGQVEFIGDVRQGITKYMAAGEKANKYINTNPSDNAFRTIEFENKDGKSSGGFTFDSDININSQIKLSGKYVNTTLSYIIRDDHETALFTIHKKVGGDAGTVNLKAIIPKETLLPGTYYLDAVLHEPNIEVLHKPDALLSFEILDTGGNHTPYSGADLGSININAIWERF